MSVPTGLTSLEQNIQKLKATKDGYMTALAADSVNPQPDYSLEGRNVSRTTWRTSLLQNIDQIDNILARYEPFEINTIEL